MTTQQTANLGLTVWTDDDDGPTREQFTANFETLDASSVSPEAVTDAIAEAFSATPDFPAGFTSSGAPLVDTVTAQDVGGIKNFVDAPTVAGIAVITAAGDQVVGGIKRFETTTFSADSTYAAGAGVILTSPNGTKYRLTVSDAGALTTTVVP